MPEDISLIFASSPGPQGKQSPQHFPGNFGMIKINRPPWFFFS